MEEKTLSKQEILKEIEKILNLHDEDITHCGFELQIGYKKSGLVNVRNNFYVNPYYGFATTRI